MGVIALSNLACEVQKCSRSILSGLGQRQTRSPTFSSLPIAGFILPSAIAVWGWIEDSRYSHKPHPSYAKTEPSHSSLTANFNLIRSIVQIRTLLYQRLSQQFAEDKALI
jgi:hypothetical protein